MAYKVAIDAAAGGDNSGVTGNGIIEKNYTLLISEYINNRLKDLNIDSFLVRSNDSTLSDSERVNIIKNKYGTGNNIIVISNRLSNDNEQGAEIMYPLRSNSRLASLIASSLESEGQNVLKYYQLRNSDNTALDDDYLIRNTANNQTIVIDYGSVSNNTDATKIKNNWEELAEAVVEAIAQYAGITYIPVSGENYHIVKKGDSLWSIAKQYGTSISTLKSLNNLSSNNLSVGQIIKLPTNNQETSNPNTTTYIVKAGDSLYQIAIKYNTTVDDIKSANNLTNNNLSIGQKLTIPSPNSASGISQNIYTVKAGDSLYQIAIKYNTTVDAIKSSNNLTSNNLSIGQKLTIPVVQSDVFPSSTITYTVIKGDSLYKIAIRYDTTVDAIKNANNLTSNSLSIGQKLTIPSTSRYKTYIVKAGDSLYQISKNNNTTVENIKKLNNLTSNNLSIGQKLIIEA